ncbi:serine/threonine-protein kinase [Microbispora bryophytorum]|uniref:serine/threonine-protein kinase n=1 Tax=Microbispora bryophytorum TaxID=1460882 RepID=UPI00340A2403
MPLEDVVDAQRDGAHGRVAARKSPFVIVLSVIWAFVPLVSFGLLTSVVIASAAIRLKSRRQGIAAGGYLVLFVAYVTTAGVRDFAHDDWQNQVAMWVWYLGPWWGGTVHAFVLRAQVFRPRVTTRSSQMRSYTGPSPAPTPSGTASRPSEDEAPAVAVPASTWSSSWDPWGTPASSIHNYSDQSRKLGPFTLLHRLGEGGQGAVYLGTAPDGRQVAIKVLHERFRGGTKERADFKREVTAAQRVPPFSTARIIDVGVEGDTAYIVSEFVPGRSLERLVREDGPLAGDSLIRLAIATSAALNAIHSAGIIHRDFKPVNVLLGPDGPRVIDFGIAKALDQVTMTSGGVKGTPAYMSPEHVSGLPISPQADIFSWASTMFYGATGRLAFSGATTFQVFQAVLHHQPDLRVLPPSLQGPVAACLDKDPRNRPTAAQLMLAIAR